MRNTNNSLRKNKSSIIKKNFFVLIFLFSICTLLSLNNIFRLNHNTGAVLSKGSSNDDDESDEDESDDDEKEDDNEDEDESKEDKSKDKSDENDDSKDDPFIKRSTTSSSKKTITSMSSKQKADTKKGKTEDVIKNPDGTYSIVKLETEGNKKKTKIKTYNAFGKLISESETESKDGEFKSETKEFNSTGSKKFEQKIESKDGKKLEIEQKDNATTTKVKIDDNKGEIIIKDRDISIGDTEPEGETEHENSSKIVASDNGFKITKGLLTASANFPIRVDSETGKVFVEANNKKIELKSMPDAILKKISSNAQISDIALVSNDDKLVYKFKQTISGKLFGIIPVTFDKNSQLDTSTGDIESNSTSIFTKTLEFLSF